MKHLNLFLACCILATSILSCKKGDQGPQGETGNANVIVYNYGSKTSSGGNIDYQITNISQGKVDSSLVLAYANPSTEAATAWYSVPGRGSSGGYEMRSFFYQTATAPSTYTYSVRIVNPGTTTAYASAVTFTKFRIFIVPANTILTGGRTMSPVDYNDYHAVCKYYNIQE